MESPVSRHRQWHSPYALIAILALYLALQIVPILQVHVAQYDESIFLDIARNIHATGLPLRSVGQDGRLFDQTPLYPYWLSLLTFFAGENLLVLRVATLLAGAGSIVLAYAIARREGSPVAGTVAALLLALSPFFHLYSYFLRMELYMCFFLLLATDQLARWDRQPHAGRLIVAGIAIALAALFKVVALAFLAAAVPWALWRLARRPARERPGRLAAVLCLTLPSLVGLALWVALMAWDDRGVDTILARWQSAAGVGAAYADPRQAVAAAGWLRQVALYVVGWELVVLFGAALLAYVSTIRRRPAITHLLLLYAAVALGVSLVVSLKEPRHLIGLLPVMGLFIALSLDWQELWDGLRRRPVALVLAGLAALALLWSFSPLQWPRGAWRVGEQWWEQSLVDRYFYNDRKLGPLQLAGEYLATHSPDDAVILTVRQGPVVGYYANRSYLFLYTRPFAENVALLREAEYLVFDRQEFWSQTSEETAELLRIISDEYEVAADFSTPDSQAVIYRRLTPP